MVSLLAVVAAFFVPASAGAQVPGGYDQKGVQHVKNIPVNGSVGANFRGKYMFVTGTVAASKADPGIASGLNYGGLYVYDISRGDDPQLVSHLPVPHYENEDVSIGGDRLLISGDGTLGGSNLVVVDISKPEAPAIEQVINMQVGDEGHTATCIQECEYAWVAGGNSIAVLRLDEAAQYETPEGAPDVQVSGASSRVEAGELGVDRAGWEANYPEFGWGTHDVQVDEAGIAWVVGGGGTIGFDVNDGAYGEGNLLAPAVVARTGTDALDAGRGVKLSDEDAAFEGDTVNDFIHHNSLRPDAGQFKSRRAGELRDRRIRRGETVLVTEEDIWNDASLVTKGGCENQGSFQTWQVKQLGATAPDQGTVKFLDAWTTEFNDALANGDDVEGMDLVPTGGFCSSHYFDEQDGLVATAWYEQGTRLLDTRDPRNIKQVGYFLAPDSVVWAAYWSPTDPAVVYVMDHQRGIDVLRVAKGGSVQKGRRVTAPLPKVLRGAAKPRRKTLRARKHPSFSWVCRVR